MNSYICIYVEILRGFLMPHGHFVLCSGKSRPGRAARESACRNRTSCSRLAAGGRNKFLYVGAVAVFAGQIVCCRGNHNQTFKVFVTIVTMEFVDGHSVLFI